MALIREFLPVHLTPTEHCCSGSGHSEPAYKNLEGSIRIARQATAIRRCRCRAHDRST